MTKKKIRAHVWIMNGREVYLPLRAALTAQPWPVTRGREKVRRARRVSS